MTQLPKLMIMGYGRHGKDTVCEMLEETYGFTFTSSSRVAASSIIMPAIRSLYDAWDDNGSYPANAPGIPDYPTVADCFNDRHNGHRKFWYDTIVAFEDKDPTALGRDIFAEQDIYCGIRNKRSFRALKNGGHFNAAVWVDRSEYHPPEDKSSCSVEEWMADYTIDNNGSLDQLRQEVDRLVDNLLDTPYEQL